MLARVAPVRQLGERQGDVTQDRRQQVVEVVSDAPREAPDRLQPFGLRKSFLQIDDLSLISDHC
jgi:hypothetical protein